MSTLHHFCRRVLTLYHIKNTPSSQRSHRNCLLPHHPTKLSNQLQLGAHTKSSLFIGTFSLGQDASSNLIYFLYMKNPKLILLYGFASSGKTTLAKRYIDEHPLSIAIEGDAIIGMMGQWRSNEEKARKMVFEHTKSIVRNQLTAGYDVLLPYLLTDNIQIEAFEEVANEYDASFLEIYIKIEKEDVISRLLERGTWGEEGSPQLTEADLPEITDLYETMEKAMNERRDVKTIISEVGDIEGTYQKFLSVIN